MMRRSIPTFEPPRKYWWCRAKFYDTKHNPPRFMQAFSGYWLSEHEAWQKATTQYASVPGAEFEIVSSRSKDRNVAKNETRQKMVDENEGSVAEVLQVRFNRKAPSEYGG